MITGERWDNWKGNFPVRVAAGSLLNSLIAVVPFARANRPVAAVIFSRMLMEHPEAMLIGSGRMQVELIRALTSLGYNVRFAGQEEQLYKPGVLHADLVVGLGRGLLKIPSFVRGFSMLYTCNTHVDERIRRLKASSEKWGLPMDEGTDRGVLLRAYQEADILLVAENDEGVGTFTSRGIPEEKIRRYHNCCDTDIWTPGVEKHPRFTFVCYASHLGLRKGLPALLDGWKRWYRGQDAILSLIGQPTSTSHALFNGAITGEAVPGVHLHLRLFPAQYQPVIEYIRRSHIAVFPTLEDAMPSSLMEMASCGLPVITTRESGFDFPAEFCRTIPADSPDALADAFEYWYSQRNTLGGPSASVRRWMVEQHSWSHFRNRFHEILHDVARDLNPVRDF